MSLLMDALKQQNNAVAETAVPPTAPARGWQYLAIGLLVLCGLGLGFALAFWFTHKPVAEVVVAAPVTAPVIATTRRHYHRPIPD